jgi:hypothetical protein
MRAPVFVRKLLLLLQVHAAIRFGQKLLRILAIFWIHRPPNAQ